MIRIRNESDFASLFKKNYKKGQMMIWVILAISIVVIIMLFFFLRGRIIRPGLEERIELDPSTFIDNCVKESVEEAIDIILPQGGFIAPKHTKMYNNINVSYLCYNAGNYLPCINEHPMFLNEIKDEIEDYISPKINRCFEDYKTEIEKRNADVKLGIMKLEVKLAPNRAFVDIEKDVSIRFKDQNYNYNEFNIGIISPVYNLARLAVEIASQEAKYCYFEYVGYMILYPKFKINRNSFSDSTEIYTLKDKKSGKEMNIAIRSCAIPPGF